MEDSQNDLPDQKQNKFDKERYDFLVECSKNNDIKKWNEWRCENPNEEIWFQGPEANFAGLCLNGVDLEEAHLEGASFRRAQCAEASFYRARCNGTNFMNAYCCRANFWQSHCESPKAGEIDTLFYAANLEGANFSDAHCEGTSFSHANCKGARFSHSDMDRKTKFMEIHIDDKTNFLTSGLSISNTDPGTLSKLEQNIRRGYWQKWEQGYYEKICKTFCFIKSLETITPKLVKFYVNVLKLICLIKSILPFSISQKTVDIILLLPRICILGFVHFFWYVSDYGYSTRRIILWFFIFIFFFAFIYSLFPSMLSINGSPIKSVSFLQMLTYSTSTMVTLGFSNINVGFLDSATPPIEPNGIGMFFVTANLVVGYFMLAVLVTRLAVLFQTMAPGYVEPKEKRYPGKR